MNRMDVLLWLKEYQQKIIAGSFNTRYLCHALRDEFLDDREVNMCDAATREAAKEVILDIQKITGVRKPVDPNKPSARAVEAAYFDLRESLYNDGDFDEKQMPYLRMFIIEVLIAREKQVQQQAACTQAHSG